MLTKEEFDKLSADEQYELYFRAAENYEILKSHSPFTPVKLENKVKRSIGRELTADERIAVYKIWGWCKKNDFKWPPDMKPMDVYSVACWAAKKLIANNQNKKTGILTERILTEEEKQAILENNPSIKTIVEGL